MEVKEPPKSSGPTIRYETITMVKAGQSKSRLRFEEDCSYGKDENKERGNWSHPIESRLATIGIAFALEPAFGWFLHNNGGVAYLIPFGVALLVLAIPFVFVEMALGQFTSQGILTCWQMIPIFKGVGVSMLVMASIFSIQGGPRQAYLVRLLGETLHSWASGNPLPWISCNETWSTNSCTTATPVVLYNAYYPNGTLIPPKTPAAVEFLEHVVPGSVQDPREETDGSLGGLVGLNVAALLSVWVVVALVLVRGVKSLGKASYITTLLPVVLGIILLVRACTLPGSDVGREYLLTPRWNALWTLQIWSSAFQWAFDQYVLALGGYLTLASYNKFHQMIALDVVLVVSASLVMQILFAVIGFSLYGYLGATMNIDVYELADPGFQATYGTIPTAMALLPGAHFWLCLYFILVLASRYGYLFGLVETIATAIVDQFPRLRRFRPLVTGVLCLLGCLMSLPLLTEGGYRLSRIMISGMALPRFLTSFGLAVCFAWYALTEYHPLVLKYDLSLMLGKENGVALFYTWSILFGIGAFFIPFLLARNAYGMVLYAPMWPSGFLSISRCATAAPIVLMLATGVVVFLLKAIRETAEKAFIPSKTWGPRLYIHRVMMLAYWRADRIDVGSVGEDAAATGQMLPLVDMPPT